MKGKPRNITASVRQRLMNLARKQGEDFQLVLTNFVIERFLYRLSLSEYRTDFILKGAALFRIWSAQSHRPTHDVDLLGKGEPSAERMTKVFRTVCAQIVEDDGLSFDQETVSAGLIKEDQEYEGIRVQCQVRLGQARIYLQIDIGFGDAVTPKPTAVQFPTMLDFPAPFLPAYPRETVVAEKFQAMVELGIANSRMKDFFDLWFLARTYAFDGVLLCQAIQTTFQRRKTTITVEPPLALTSDFGTDTAKVTQWKAFVRKGKLDVDSATLEQVCEFLNRFLMPPVRAIATESRFEQSWRPAGPWLSSPEEKGTAAEA